jgi:sirohydrochlorin cobaltochelatase
MKIVAEGYQTRHPELAVRFGFLESAEPFFLNALEKCAAGFDQIQVLPLFLFQGTHAQKDIPGMIQVVQKKYPGCLIQSAPALGAHPALSKLLLKRLISAGYAQKPPQGPVLLVGHGTEESESQNLLYEMEKIFSQENQSAPVEACFIGLGDPFLSKKLEEWKDKFPASSWWVAPHLLFPGFFLEKIQKEISEFQSQNPTLKIFTAPPLGADEFLFQALDARRSEII